MRFSYTHHMPYTDIDEAGQDWPVANKQFDPKRGAELYREYIDNKVDAEEVGDDWIGCNEHHMSPYGLTPNPNLIAVAVIGRIQDLHGGPGHGVMNINMKIGNVPDAAVRHGMEPWGRHVAPAVRDL